MPGSRVDRKRGADKGPPPESAEPTSQAELGGFFPELIRRGFTMGFTGLFMTEEAIRKALGDSVPRDWIDFVIDQSERTRHEFVDRLSREFAKVLSALDPVEVARRLLDGRTIEVTAQFRLKPESPKEKSGLSARFSAAKSSEAKGSAAKSSGAKTSETRTENPGDPSE